MVELGLQPYVLGLAGHLTLYGNLDYAIESDAKKGIY